MNDTTRAILTQLLENYRWVTIRAIHQIGAWSESRNYTIERVEEYESVRKFEERKNESFAKLYGKGNQKASLFFEASATIEKINA